MKTFLLSTFLHSPSSFLGRKGALSATTRIANRVVALQMAAQAWKPNENDEITLSPSSPQMYKFALPFTLLSALAIAISYADRANLSTAIIPMAARFNWDSTFSGLVLSAFWAGYALTQIIGGKTADTLGGEKLLIAALLLWSICTGITPWAANLGAIPVLLVRVLLGVGEGMALPAVHSMIQKYISPQDRSTSASIVTAACYLGSLLSNYFSPKIIEKFGWESCFQIFSIVPTVIWLPLWFLFILAFNKFTSSQDKITPSIESSDQDTLFVMNAGEEEVVTIDNNLNQDKEETLTVRELLTKPPVWAIIAAQYGQSWGMIGLLSWLPKYFSAKFQVPIAELGTFTVLPYLIQLLVSSGSGILADKLILSGRRPIDVRNGLQTLGMLVPAICLAGCALLTSLTAQQSFLLITLGLGFSALTCGAVSCNHFDISPKNAGTIFGLGNTASCLAGFLAVPICGYLFDQTNSWNLIFLLFAFHYVIGNILWLKFSSDQPLQKYNKID